MTSDGHYEGFVQAAVPLTQGEWDSAAEDLECAWGVYTDEVNDGYTDPTEDDRLELGHWGQRTRASVEAWREGPIHFLAWMIGGLVVSPAKVSENLTEIFWI